MQPTYVSLIKAFGAAERYSVPLFQRPYVWNRDENWQPLWDDISGLADRVFLSPDNEVRGHFLGTVVFEQVSTKTGNIGVREIIDGQQRLTTLQLLLQAVRHALGRIGHTAMEDGDVQRSKAARDVGTRMMALTVNAGYDDEEMYKVWPTNEDRAPFREVMDANNPEELGGVSSRMAEAYRFFLDKVAAWLTAEPHEGRIQALDEALRKNVRLIVLDLDKSDEPQAIFETLNAHGTPLLPADLIKNWLLWEASRQKLSLDTLYNKFWLRFDHDHEYWRAKVGTGHAARARVDTFLQNWLTMRCGEQIAVKHLYDRFTKHQEQKCLAADGTMVHCDVEGLMADIASNSERFQTIEAPKGKTRFDVFLWRLSTLGLVVFTPFLLALMSRKGSDQADRDRIARMLESYLVRRMICNLETRGYGSLCVLLLQALDRVDSGGPASAEIHALLSQDSGKAVVWPSDDMFERDWLRRQFYGSIRQIRVVMILRAIEEQFHAENAKAEPILQFDYSKLQIEHVLPQSWRDHWPVASDEAARLREAKVNTVGNLTLVSSALNPAMSNAAWLDIGAKVGKRSALEMHSILRLNDHLVKKHLIVWDEGTIDARAKSLFDVARKIWAPSSAFSNSMDE
jgi:hypothetical protein